MATPLKIYSELRTAVQRLNFGSPVTHVYNPLEYARVPHRKYLELYGTGRREIVLLGMNPGPWGMAQTGIPFGEIYAVRDWMKINGRVYSPKRLHPKRPVTGFACERSEVSGARLWGWVREKFKTPDDFFRRFIVLNYCPLVFMEESGRNRTPDKLPAEERNSLEAVCNRALLKLIDYYRPKFVVGVGAFAEKQAVRVLRGENVSIGKILHPSPASPAANNGWALTAEKQLTAMGIALPRT